MPNAEEIGRVEQALRLGRTGRVDEAIKLLRAELKASPDNSEALDALWSMALDQGTPEAATAEVLAGIRRGARTGDNDLVTRYWIELLRTTEDLALDPTLAARVVEILDAGGLAEEAVETLVRTQPTVTLAAPGAVVIRLARAAARLGAPCAIDLIEQALEHPETPPDVREQLQELAAEVPEPEPEPVEAIEPEPDLAPKIAPVAPAEAPKHRLKLMHAVPTRLGESSLFVKVGDKDRNLPFEQIKAVAVAGIKGEAGGRPYLVVDLLLDPPWDEQEEVRAVRILSTAYDPRPMFGGNDLMEGYKKFLYEFLMICHAVPLPDADTARGRPFRAFASLRDYEQRILHVG
jgi:hypothetical protein